jgi:hypothetical protein
MRAELDLAQRGEERRGSQDVMECTCKFSANPIIIIIVWKEGTHYRHKSANHYRVFLLQT